MDIQCKSSKFVHWLIILPLKSVMVNLVGKSVLRRPFSKKLYTDAMESVNCHVESTVSFQRPVKPILRVLGDVLCIMYSNNRTGVDSLYYQNPMKNSSNQD